MAFEPNQSLEARYQRAKDRAVRSGQLVARMKAARSVLQSTRSGIPEKSPRRLARAKQRAAMNRRRAIGSKRGSGSSAGSGRGG